MRQVEADVEFPALLRTGLASEVVDVEAPCPPRSPRQINDLETYNVSVCVVQIKRSPLNYQELASDRQHSPGMRQYSRILQIPL
jgi:hypothetical protein